MGREIFLTIHCFIICLPPVKMLVASIFESPELKKIEHVLTVKICHVILFESTH